MHTSTHWRTCTYVHLSIYLSHPVQEAEVVAIGLTWAAVYTSFHHIRVFSFSGVQLYVLSVPGPVVTMTGHGPDLVIVYHASVPMLASLSGRPMTHQNLRMMWLDIDNRKKLCDEAVPLSPNSELKWLDFSDTGLLFTMDAAGVVRLCNTSFGYLWVSVLDTRADPELPANKGCWPVMVSENSFECVLLTKSKVPQVHPRPLLHSVRLCLPFLRMVKEEVVNGVAKRTSNKNYSRKMQDVALKKLLVTEKAFVNDEKVEVRSKREMDNDLGQLILNAVKKDEQQRALDLSGRINTKECLLEVIKKASNEWNKPVGRTQKLVKRMNLVMLDKFPDKV